MLFAIKTVIKRQDNPIIIAFSKIAIIEKHKQLHTIIILKAQAIITVIKSKIPLKVNLIP